MFKMESIAEINICGTALNVILDQSDLRILKGQNPSLKLRLNNRGHVIFTSKQSGSVELRKFIVDSNNIPWTGCYVLHKNGNKLDNRKENLIFSYKVRLPKPLGTIPPFDVAVQMMEKINLEIKMKLAEDDD